MQQLAASGALVVPAPLPSIAIEPPRQPAHGDFSCNIGMLLAKPCRQSPLVIAELITSQLRSDPATDAAGIAHIEVAAPGFINFRLRQEALFQSVETLLRDPLSCGRKSLQQKSGRVQIEFVSANPTGPLHVGHGRGAAYGAALRNVMRTAGYNVSTEYYVNDAGRQMDILALSVWLRNLEQAGIEMHFPANGYRGDYVAQIAIDLAEKFGRRFVPNEIRPPEIGDLVSEEEALDIRVAHCRAVLGEENYRLLHGFGCSAILEGIKQDLLAFGVTIDNWYSERSLIENGQLENTMAQLRATGHVFRKDGAEWFRSTAFNDEKDRVLIRENGAPTYFASDVAYHVDKFARGFDHLINIWGADHHGYIARVKATLQALELDPNRLEILLVQFASLFRGGEKVQMSTRSGEFVTLSALIDEVGVDAARYFYSSRRSDQHLDFDLDLAKAQNQDNPVYYLQYAHARICSVFRQVAQQWGPCEPAHGIEHLARLVEPREHQLAALLARYADVITGAAAQREPHTIANFLREVATEYHAFYNNHKINVDDVPLRQARLALCEAVRLVLSHGLSLLGVSAPREM